MQLFKSFHDQVFKVSRASAATVLTQVDREILVFRSGFTHLHLSMEKLLKMQIFVLFVLKTQFCGMAIFFSTLKQSWQLILYDFLFCSQ